MGRSNLKNYSKVKASIETIYKDRLIVNGFIIDLTNLLHKKELAIVGNDKLFFERSNESVNEQIESIISAFKETYLTDKEEKTLLRFESGIKKLAATEAKSEFNEKLEAGSRDSIGELKMIESLKTDLKTLASIQLAEGKRKLLTSEKAVDNMNMFQSLEDYMVIIISILIFVVILIPRPKLKEEGLEDK